jgi:hypothetical protein
MNQICLINQPKGIGDIIFCQKIGHHFKELGYRIIWPVREPYKWVKDYIKDFEFPSLEEDFDEKDFFLQFGNRFYKDDKILLLPIMFALSNKPLEIMLAKYQILNLVWYDWADYFNPIRNFEKEDELFKKLNLTDGEKYIFRSTNILHPPRTQRLKTIPLTTNMKIIDMDFINGFTLFDWLKVVENAEEIHVIDSSISFLIEKYQIKAKKMCLYSRSPIEDSWLQTRMLFKNTDWEFRR